MALTITWSLVGGAATIQFPPLQPLSRSWTMGSYPVTMQPAWGTQPLMFRHGLYATSYGLTLQYELLTTAEAALIRSHYHERRGGLLPFTLPAIVWLGHTSPTGPFPAATQWTYASEPDEQHRSGGLIDMSVSLVSVS